MRWKKLILPLLLASGISGCSQNPANGWRMAHSQSGEHKTVAVPLFRNQSYQQGLERDLGKALVNEIETTTPYKVTGTSKADTMLEGTITNVELIPLSTSVTTGLSSEMLFKVTIDFKWIDLTTGETLTARNRFSASAVFFASRPTQEPIELARFQVVQQLSRDLVDAMQTNW
jgi:hypothetical protein